MSESRTRLTREDRVRRRELAQQWGSMLRLARKKAGISQAELAAQSGIGASTVSRLERGEVLPDLYSLIRLERVLKKPISAWIPIG